MTWLVSRVYIWENIVYLVYNQNSSITPRTEFESSTTTIGNLHFISCFHVEEVQVVDIYYQWGQEHDEPLQPMSTLKMTFKREPEHQEAW